MRGGAQPQLRCESTPKPIRYLQDRSGTEKGQEQSCLLQLARRGLARARLPHRRARSSTARQADSYEKVVRRFTDITGKSRSRTRCRTTRLFSAVSRRDLSSKLTWVAHGRKAGVRPSVKTPSSPYKLAPSYMEAVLKYTMYLFIHLDSFELNVIPGDLLKAPSSDRCTRAAR